MPLKIQISESESELEVGQLDDGWLLTKLFRGLPEFKLKILCVDPCQFLC